MTLLLRRPRADEAGAPIDARTRSTPSILWIELTSRCPFDCVFCSRRLLRGNGTHMDLAMYRALIAELDRPDVIRLNYSGESSHYPHLVEAVALAAATGAEVELVTALAALPEHHLQPLVDSGLQRLTISLHTLDAEQFRAIYRFSSLDAMRHRIERIVALGRARRPWPLLIDFAFVAMARNLDQLPAIAAYAGELGLGHVAVHPVIRRDPIAETFADELDEQGRLREGFRARLAQVIDRTRRERPEIALSVSTPELGPRQPLGTDPAHHPWPLDGPAVLHDCDQDPWQTVHVLADGRVVSCEVRDQIELGRLGPQRLREIWHGEAYRALRTRFADALEPACRGCPYKRAHQPGALPRRIDGHGGGAHGLLHGWYPPDQGVVWSRPQAVLALSPPRWPARPRLRGRLPAARGGDNRLRIAIEGAPAIEITQSGDAPVDVDLALPLPPARRGALVYRLDVAHPLRPIDDGVDDTRRLGFALFAAGA